MGCVNSKKDSGDFHPNVFRVVNVDEGGAGLWSGQLEVSDTELVLYREGRDATVWPLRCLRRYGFDGEIFSFESGRRCTTGEGIYAFRCRRAGVLFRTLQQNIQLRNIVTESLPFQIPVNMLPATAASLPRSLPGEVVNARSPIRARHTSDTESSNRQEQPPPPTAARPPIIATTSSPRSPSTTEILEVMPLFSVTETSSGNNITNFFQKQDFRMPEYNNNRPERQLEHSYCNSFNHDLAALRNTLRRGNVLDTTKLIEKEASFLQRHINEGTLETTNAPVSPTASDTSEHYARLTLDNCNDRPYMNLGLNSASIPRYIQSDSPVTDTFTFSVKKDVKPSTSFAKEEMNTYANVNVGELLEQTNLKPSCKQNALACLEQFSHLDTYTSMVPEVEHEVNYAVLDIENKEPGSPDSCSSTRKDGNTSPPATTGSKLVSQSSLENTIIIPNTSLGYTTIDFDKTVALTSVASGSEVDTDGTRKTRHNSINIVSSPNGTY